MYMYIDSVHDEKVTSCFRLLVALFVIMLAHILDYPERNGSFNTWRFFLFIHSCVHSFFVVRTHCTQEPKDNGV